MTSVLPQQLWLVAPLAVLACSPASEGTAGASRSRPPDRTEVRMEIITFEAGAGPPMFADEKAPEAKPSAHEASADEPALALPHEPALDKALAPARPRLAACYKKGLAIEPTLSGLATFDATIGKDGKVVSARLVKREGLNEEVIGCVLSALKTMAFDGTAKSQIIPLAFGAAATRAGDAGAPRPGGGDAGTARPAADAGAAK